MITLTRFKVKTNLRVYTCIVKVSRDHEYFELDVFDGEPYFRDGTRKYVDEAIHIGGYEDEPFTYPLKPIELAKKLIDEWERPQKLENHLKLKGYFIHINEEEEAPAKVTPPPKPLIFDHEDKDYQNYIAYLTEHPEEIDALEPKERKKLLKENMELRLSYHEWRFRSRKEREAN